jgi:hypothetical protein
MQFQLPQNKKAARQHQADKGGSHLSPKSDPLGIFKISQTIY